MRRCHIAKVDSRSHTMHTSCHTEFLRVFSLVVFLNSIFSHVAKQNCVRTLNYEMKLRSVAVMDDDTPDPARTSSSIFHDLVVHLAVPVHLPNLLNDMTTGVRATLIPVFCRMLGTSDAVTGIVTAAPGLARFLCAVPAGVATERWGLLLVMTIGLIINVAGSAIGAMAFGWIMLALASVVWGVARETLVVSRQVFLANVIERHRRGRLMSIVGGEARWASVFGPLLGGVIIDRFGPRAAAAAIAPLTVLCGVCLYSSRIVRDVDERVQRDHILHHEAHDTKPASVMTVLAQNWSVITRLGMYASNLMSLRTCRKMMLPLAAINLNMSPTYVGFVLASSFAVDATFFFLGGMIMDRFGRRYAAVPTTVNIGLGFILLSSVKTVWGVFVSAIVFGVADSLGAGLLGTLTADHIPASGGPTYVGILRTLENSGLLIGPILAGSVAAWMSFEAACLVLGVIGIANGVWAYFLLPDVDLAKDPAAGLKLDAPKVLTTISETEAAEEHTEEMDPHESDPINRVM